ncbi:MAG: MMPL family transporter, partial [Actinomycetota bacterium]|nr:MMPL family transporter [Actinomycetota bacterium]
MVRLAHWTLAHRRVVLLAWLALVVAMTPLGGQLSRQVTPGGYESPKTQAAQADSILAKRFRASTLGVLVEQPVRSGAAAARRIRLVARRLDSLPNVEKVMRSTSRRPGVSLFSLTVRGGEDGSLSTARELLDLTRSLRDSGIRALPLGFDAFHISGTDLAQKDMTRARWLSSLLLLAVLLFAFRTLAAAALPIIVGWSSVTVSLGLLALVSEVAPLSELVSNGVALISTALSVDYMLFMISRFREYRRQGRDQHQAVLATVAGTGRAVFFAGVVIVIALAALLLADTRAVRSMALGMMIAA